MAKPIPKVKPKPKPLQLQQKVFPGNSHTYRVKKPTPEPVMRIGQVKGAGKVGAPLKEFSYDRVEELAAVGLSNAQIAECCLCSTRTVGQRMVDDPKFAEAVRRGRSRLMDTIASNLMRLAQKRDKTALIFLSKVHLKWSEWQQPIMQMTPEQLAAAVRGELGKVDGTNDTQGTQEDE